MKIGPKYKIARRLGDRIFPKCQTTKFTVSGVERKTHGKKKPRALSEFGRQLIEKQKARFTYGVTEKQFSNYVKAASAHSHGSPAEELHRLLESRLDNAVFRLGLAKSRLAARQFVSHGHILVNGRKVTIPSYQIRVGEKIGIRVGSRDSGPFRDLGERAKDITTPSWLVLDAAKWEGEVKAVPAMTAGESNLSFPLILEFYSRV